MTGQKCRREEHDDTCASSLPHSNKNTRKRSVSSPSHPFSPLLLNNNDSFDFSTCHSCGIRDGSLQSLESQWRVVLLCRGCLARIRSASVCSYCFDHRDLDVLVCRSCSSRVHLVCIPLHRRYVTLWEFDSASFICIDCRAIPRPCARNQSLAEILLETLVGKVSSAAKKKTLLAARARSNALKKADEARIAIELAFDAIMFARDSVSEDERSNSQLSESKNGCARQTSLSYYLRVKKESSNGSTTIIQSKSRKRKRRINEKTGICIKSNFVCKSNKFMPQETEVRHANDSNLILDKKIDQNFGVVVDYDEENGSDEFPLLSFRESADSNSFMEAFEIERCSGEGSSNLPEEKD